MVPSAVRVTPGGAGGALGPGAMLSFLPKKYQGIGQMLLPYLGKFLGGGDGAKAAKGALPDNPFMKE